MIFPRHELRGLKGLAKIPSWAKTVATQPADLVLDFQGLLRSALIAKLCRAPGGHIVGLSDAREGAGFFYHHKADVTGIDHAVDRYLALVAALGIPAAPPLEWPLPEGSGPAGFADTAPFVLLHPFSRGAGKSLSIADVNSFCQALAPFRVVVAGRSDESVPPSDNVANLLNRTTLAELVWLIRRAAFVVSVDSGPMHIAAALTPHLLSIHTWSDPRKVGPYRPEAWIWKDGQLFQPRNRDAAETHQAAADIITVARFVRTQIHR
ncbi:MAG: glycosyltransferase family 9 protein [Chthoniobacter sp.]